MLSPEVGNKIDEISTELTKIELDVLTQGYSLADAVREGSAFIKQSKKGWGDGVTNACFLTTAFLAAKARGVIE